MTLWTAISLLLMAVLAVISAGSAAYVHFRYYDAAVRLDSLHSQIKSIRTSQQWDEKKMEDRVRSLLSEALDDVEPPPQDSSNLAEMQQMMMMMNMFGAGDAADQGPSNETPEMDLLGGNGADDE